MRISRNAVVIHSTETMLRAWNGGEHVGHSSLHQERFLQRTLFSIVCGSPHNFNQRFREEIELNTCSNKQQWSLVADNLRVEYDWSFRISPHGVAIHFSMGVVKIALRHVAFLSHIGVVHCERNSFLRLLHY